MFIFCGMLVDFSFLAKFDHSNEIKENFYDKELHEGRPVGRNAIVVCLFFQLYSDGNRRWASSHDSVYDKDPDAGAVALLKTYQLRKDSIMSPVIGHSAANLVSYRPESPLSNLLADVIKQSTAKLTGEKVDVAVMNMGGIRSALSEGEITYGDVFEITPFENALCLLTMDGATLLRLFEQIAALHGEGLSGARLVISKDGKLLEATVAGKAIDPQAVYRIATIDYLAEGNDKMTAFRDAKSKTFPADGLLRDALLNYVKECEQKGVFVQAKVEGRIVVK